MVMVLVAMAIGVVRMVVFFTGWILKHDARRGQRYVLFGMDYHRDNAHIIHHILSTTTYFYMNKLLLQNIFSKSFHSLLSTF